MLTTTKLLQHAYTALCELPNTPLNSPPPFHNTYALCSAIEKHNAKESELKLLVRLFFTFLDHTEESENGHISHPIVISNARALAQEPLSTCLEQMKKLTE